MRNVEIYIENTRLDLFNDETIQITDSIQDVRDIKKVFTTFSQTFKVPASDTNNKVFKHYYNADIDGYDGRFRKDALIKIDGTDFKNGRMRLDSVDLHNNIPTTYNLTFFGSTVQLTELLGEDRLKDLQYTSTLAAFDFGYNFTYVKNRFDGTETDTTIIFPFISAKNYYFSSSNSSATYNIELPDGAEVRNVESFNSGVLSTDLKPAIKVSKVLEAIEEKYGFTFSNDFFSDTDLTELYLWLHREKGQITGQLDTSSQTYNISDFTPDGTPTYTSNTIETDLEDGWVIKVTITPANSSDTYDVAIPESEDGPYTSQTGTNTFTFEFLEVDTYTPNITVSSNGNLGNYSIDIELEAYKWDTLQARYVPSGVEYNYLPISSQSSELTIGSQMPKIKIIDFLTSLFKMFNLTAYFNGSELVVKTLDSYYASGNSYDITKYIETSSGNIAKSNIYRNVSFEFPEAKTFAVYNANETTGEEFGNENFEDRNLDGGVYKIGIKFEKIMYERMTDQDTGNETSIQWGWFVDDNKNEYIGNPLLFYTEKISTGVIRITDGTSSPSGAFNYYRPMSTKSDSTQTLHFGSEIDEYTNSVNNESLFKNYYKTYIDNVFDKKARIYKFTAYLPNQILNRYELNDIFIIAGREYRINKIKTNLINGKTELELINKL